MALRGDNRWRLGLSSAAMKEFGKAFLDELRLWADNLPFGDLPKGLIHYTESDSTGGPYTTTIGTIYTVTLKVEPNRRYRVEYYCSTIVSHTVATEQYCYISVNGAYEQQFRYYAPLGLNSVAIHPVLIYTTGPNEREVTFGAHSNSLS